MKNKYYIKPTRGWTVAIAMHLVRSHQVGKVPHSQHVMGSTRLRASMICIWLDCCIFDDEVLYCGR